MPKTTLQARRNDASNPRAQLVIVDERGSTLVSVSYGIDHEYDYTKLEKSVAIQGTAYGPSGQLCREAIAALKDLAAPDGAEALRDRYNEQYEQTPEGKVLKEIFFGMSWEVNIPWPEAILEAEYCVETSYPVWKAQIDEIPYGDPYVQEAVCKTIGSITVTGAVTAGSRKAADDWAIDKKRFLSVYLETCQIRGSRIFPPLNSEAVRFRAEFTFVARTVSLPVQGLDSPPI